MIEATYKRKGDWFNLKFYPVVKIDGVEWVHYEMSLSKNGAVKRAEEMKTSIEFLVKETYGKVPGRVIAITMRDNGYELQGK